MSGTVSYEFFKSRLEEGCICKAFINGTGSISQKGKVAALSKTADNTVVTASDDSGVIAGVIYESGILNGESVRVAISGETEVMLEDGQDALAGYWCGVGQNGGMYQKEQPESEDLPKRIGYSLQSKTGGASVLAKVLLRFY